MATIRTSPDREHEIMLQFRLGDCRDIRVISMSANPCVAGIGFAQANLPCFLFNSNLCVATVAYQAEIYPPSLSETG